MTAITICQPYAELIVRGDKPIENRSWPTNYRGNIAIHAGKSRAWMDDGDDERYSDPPLAFGAIVGVAEIVACLNRDAKEWPERWRHLQEHEHANGPWCWVFENIRRVRPIPYRGAQGLWIYPHEIAA